MGAVCSSETSVDFYKIIWCYNPQTPDSTSLLSCSIVLCTMCVYGMMEVARFLNVSSWNLLDEFWWNLILSCSLWLHDSDFWLALLTPPLQSLLITVTTQLTISDCLRLNPFWLDCLLVCLLLWLTWFRFTDELVLCSPFYCYCSCSYLHAAYIALWYPRRCLFLARTHGHACWFCSNNLVSKSLQLPYPHPSTRLTPSDGLCPKIISP